MWFAIRMLRAVQMMEIPVLKSWIHSLVMDGLTQALVDPGKIDIRMQTTGPNYAPAKSRSRAKGKEIFTCSSDYCWFKYSTSVHCPRPNNLSVPYYHIKAKTKCPPFCRQHFHMHFFLMKTFQLQRNVHWNIFMVWLTIYQNWSR